MGCARLNGIHRAGEQGDPARRLMAEGTTLGNHCPAGPRTWSVRNAVSALPQVCAVCTQPASRLPGRTHAYLRSRCRGTGVWMPLPPELLARLYLPQGPCIYGASWPSFYLPHATSPHFTGLLMPRSHACESLFPSSLCHSASLLGTRFPPGRRMGIPLFCP